MDLLHDHIVQEGSINLRAAKSLLYGPPHVGKTSLRMRLTGEIENLSQVIPPTSTGIEKAITVNLYHTMDTNSVLIDNTNCWSSQDIESQVNTIINCVLNSKVSETPTKISRSNSSDILHEFLYDDKANESKEIMHSESERESNLLSSSPSSVSQSEMHTEKESNPAVKPTEVSQTLRKNDSTLPTFLGKMVKDKNWKEIRELLENAQDITLLQIIDTGGQPEFHEILPLLMTGPVLYLVFIKLTLGLNEQYEITYTQEKGTVSPIKYNSILTIKETLLQLLTAISSTSLSSDKSSALILGTHKDQVSEKVIRMLENEIQRCKDFDIFLHKNILKKFTIQQESQLLFPLDNKDGTQEELQLLLDALSEIVHSHFQSEKIPTSWYFYYFALRKIYENTRGICTIDEAVNTGSSFGISEENIEIVLKHFHNRFGTILFYPEIPSLSGWVICDPNVIFKPISHLIAASFGENIEDLMLVEQIRQSGQFSLSLLEKVIERLHSSIPALAIIDLLKYHSIISEIEAHDDSLVYFMPCLLRPDTGIREETSEQINKLDPAPLVIQFPLGCIPVGVFPALIVHLSKKWILKYHIQQYKNRVSFIGDKQTMSGVDVTLRTDRIELHVDCKSLHDARQLCVSALQDIKNILLELKKSISYVSHHFYEVGFHCPAPSCQQQNDTHFAVCYDLKRPLRMMCRHPTLCCREKCFDLQQKHKIWFPEHDVSSKI